MSYEKHLLITFVSFDEGLFFSDIVSSIMKPIGFFASFDLLHFSSSTNVFNELVSKDSFHGLFDKNRVLQAQCIDDVIFDIFS